ncbi:MAG: ABC transporter ATP-binding protein [Lachnospiraceae bacterium]|nr:ABC transporter ATP-binding protein [Lachnospiraceae bacterium]
MLTLQNVKKTYGEFELNVSLQVQEGQITGLIGTNGAGKSSTFKAILGLIHTEGAITFDNRDIKKLTAKEKQEIGAQLSESGFSGYFKIRDIIPVMSAMYDAFSAEEFKQKCKQFKLPLYKEIKDFSTGMKAKLKVLLALSHDAKLLILDEPTAGLDIIAREEILDMLRSYVEDGSRSVLISSHISADLEGLCDDFYFIDDGKIIMHEETDVLLSNYGLMKMTKEQFETVDKEYILRFRKESFGYTALTDQKAFYAENYPGIAIEKGNIDEFILMMVKGEK